jgi:hypothetical protein
MPPRDSSRAAGSLQLLLTKHQWFMNDHLTRDPQFDVKLGTVASWH